MPSRRRALHTAALALTGFAGCLAENQDEPASPTPTTSPSPASETPTATEPLSGTPTVEVAALSVADFVIYPLAGTHPHVHRRAGIQYVVVRIATEMDWGSVTDGLTLELDGESAALAERQPVSWDHDDVEVAFAVSKDREVETGVLRFDDTTLRSLSAEIVARLTTPPVFEVTDPSVSPSELQAGETVSATVAFTLSNVGDSAGTFGASLKGNYVSGANTVTATLEPGAEREVTASVELHGEGEEARVRLDWGADEWVETVPVVGTETG